MRSVIIKQTVAVGLLACFVYSIGSWWGIPQANSPERVQSWGVDDESPLGPMAEIHNIIKPKPNQWLSYPLLYSFVTAAAYAPYMAYLFLTGGLTEISASYPFGLSDPVGSLKILTVIAHLVSVTMGALVVAAAYDIGMTLANRRTAILYALLVLLSFPLIYYARNGNVDAMAMAFIALATAAFFRIARVGFDARGAVWLGLFAGLALAAKESSIGAFLAIPLFLIYWQFTTEKNKLEAVSARLFFKFAGFGLFAAFLAFGIGSGLFIDPNRYFAHIEYLRGLLEKVASSDTAAVNTYAYSLAGNLGYLQAMLRNLVAAVSVPGILIIFWGIIEAIRQRSVSVLPVVLALVYFMYLFLSYRLAQVRYLMPVSFFLLFYVAFATDFALNARSRIYRFVGPVLGAVTLAIGLLNSIDITYQMIFDSRHAAAAWLAPRTEPGETVAYFGPASKLPFLEEGVRAEQATGYKGMYDEPRVDAAKVNEILDKWVSKPPAFIIIMPDHSNPSTIPYSNTVPPELYRGLRSGSFGYAEVGFFQTPSLFRWLQQPVLDYPTVNPPIRIFASTNQR